MIHDLFCPTYNCMDKSCAECCQCDLIAKVRDDERSEAVARMAKTIQDMDTSLSDWDLYAHLVHAAADESMEAL